MKGGGALKTWRVSRERTSLYLVHHDFDGTRRGVSRQLGAPLGQDRGGAHHERGAARSRHDGSGALGDASAARGASMHTAATTKKLRAFNSYVLSFTPPNEKHAFPSLEP